MNDTQPPGKVRKEMAKIRDTFNPIVVDGDLVETFKLLDRIHWYEDWRKGAIQFLMYPGRALTKGGMILGIMNAAVYPLFGIWGMMALDIGVVSVMFIALVSSYSPVCIDTHHGIQLEDTIRADPRIMRYMVLQDLIDAHNRHIRTVNVYVDAVNRKIKKRKKKYERRYEALVDDARYVKNAIENAKVDLAERGKLGSVIPGDALAAADERLIAMRSHRATLEDLFEVNDEINAIEDVAEMGITTL